MVKKSKKKPNRKNFKVHFAPAKSMSIDFSKLKSINFLPVIIVLWLIYAFVLILQHTVFAPEDELPTSAENSAVQSETAQSIPATSTLQSSADTLNGSQTVLTDAQPVPTGGATEETTAVTMPAYPEPTRKVYVTFDDGPSAYTEQVLDTLDRYGARATFFTVGRYVDKHPTFAADIVQRGNLIACHTYTHDMELCYASADAFMDEVAQWKSAVMSACGWLPERICVRFPGGSTTKHADAVRDDIMARLKAAWYCPFDWNAGDNDKWAAGNTENLPEETYFMRSYTECMNWYRNDPDTPVVLLLHETEEVTVQILPDILDDLKRRGYSFHLMNEHPKWNEFFN